MNTNQELAPEVTQKPDEQAAELGGGTSSFADFKANAPKVIVGGKPVAKEPVAASPKDDEEFVVKAATSPSKEVDGSQSTEKKPVEEELLSQPKSIKIGDIELPENEWIEAKQDRENRSAWQKNLTMKSQIASALPDERVELLIPYAMKQKEVPENLAEIVFKDSEIPEFVDLEDEDGDTVKVNLKKLPKEVLEALGKNVFNKLYPEVEKLRKETLETKTKIDEDKKNIQAFQEHDATRQAVSFMKEHPDYGISIRKGETLKEVLGSILSSGDLHPELANANKFVMLLNHIRSHGGTLEEAYTFFEGNNLAKSKIKQKQLENQANDIRPETGVPTTPQTAAEKKMESMRDPRLKQLVADFG